MSGHRDDGTFAENKAHHPNRKVGRTKLCKDCGDAEADQPSGRCFGCAEEMAYMLGDLHNEFGGEPMSKESIRKSAYGY